MRILLFLFIVATFVYYGKKGYDEKNLGQEKKEQSHVVQTNNLVKENIDTLLLSEVGIGARANSIFTNKYGDKLMLMGVPSIFKGEYHEGGEYKDLGVDVGRYFQVKLDKINGKDEIVEVLKRVDDFEFDFSSLKKKYKYVKGKFDEFSEGDYLHYNFIVKNSEIDFNGIEDMFYESNLEKDRYYHIFYVEERLYDPIQEEYGDFYIIKKMVLIN